MISRHTFACLRPLTGLPALGIPVMAEDGSERLQAVFDMFDTEGCGYISVNHFVQLAAEHFGSSDWDSSIQEVSTSRSMVCKKRGSIVNRYIVSRRN